jgi:hypothetical protein
MIGVVYTTRRSMYTTPGEKSDEEEHFFHNSFLPLGAIPVDPLDGTVTEVAVALHTAHELGRVGRAIEGPDHLTAVLEVDSETMGWFELEDRLNSVGLIA